MARKERISAIHCPTGVGATFHGLSRGPKALVDAGIIPKLQEWFNVTSYEALDHPVEGSYPSPDLVRTNGVRDEELAVEVNQAIKRTVSHALTERCADEDGDDAAPFTLVLGGVCSMVPAVLSAIQQEFPSQKVGIIWFDADADLSVPNESPGSTDLLAFMAFSHMALREGSLGSMERFSHPDGSAVADPTNTVFFGLNTLKDGVVPRTHLTWLLDNHYHVTTASRLAKSTDAARHAATQAIEYLVANGCDKIVVHVDVDAIDGAQFPLGNIPSFTGVGLEQFGGALDVFVAERRVCGLTLTEMNPDRDTGGVMTAVLVERAVKSFEGRARTKG